MARKRIQNNLHEEETSVVCFVGFYSLYSYRFCSLPVAVVLSCSGSELEVTVTRVYNNYANEESFILYKGTSTSGEQVYSLGGGTNHATVNDTICLEPGDYYLAMSDSFGDGWTSGLSTVTFITEDNSYGPYTISYGRTGYASFFIPPPLTPIETWLTTQEGQGNDSWKTSVVSWTSTSSLPPYSVTTRYFRHSIHTTEMDRVLSLHITTASGFIAYLNGHEVLRYHMPSGPASASTFATSTDETAEAHSFYGHISQYANGDSSIFELALELHASQVVSEAVEDLSAFYELRGSSLSLILDGYTSTATHATTGSESNEQLFDGNTETKWSMEESDFSDIHVTYTLPRGSSGIVNRYVITSANDMPTRDPTSWKLYGSNDNIQWTLMDYQVNAEFASRYQENAYNIYNNVPYSSYKLQILAHKGDAMLQFSEWKLLVDNRPFVMPVLSYPMSTLELFVGDPQVVLQPVVSFLSYTVFTDGDVPLPANIVVNENGVITISTVATPQTTFSIRGQITSEMTSTTSITVSITSCSLPSRATVTFQKTAITDETFSVVENGETLVSSRTTTVSQCLELEKDYTIYLDKWNQWSATSLLDVVITMDGVDTTLMQVTKKDYGTVSYVFSLKYPVLPAKWSSFLYLFGSVPANWNAQSYDASSWQTLDGTNRPSSGNVQLYRKTFTAAKEGYDAFELRVKARWGIVVYLNGEELYRRRVSGDVTTSTVATGGLEAPTWRSIVGLVDRLNEGENTLAVAVIDMNEGSAVSTFDMTFRMIASTTLNSRLFDTTSSHSSLFTLSNDDEINKGDNIDLTLNGDRAEVFNRYCLVISYDNADTDPLDWSLYAKNEGETYTLLHSVSYHLFSTRGTELCTFLPTQKTPYTHYRLTITESRDHGDVVRLTGVAFYTYVFPGEPSASLLMPSSIDAFVGHPLLPLAMTIGDDLINFTINPALPAGIILSTRVGTISGTPTAESAATTYSLSAMNGAGEAITTTFSLTVSSCSGDSTLYVVKRQMGYYSSGETVALYNGETSSAALLFRWTDEHEAQYVCLSPGRKLLLLSHSQAFVRLRDV